MPRDNPNSAKTPSALNDPSSEANRGGADAVNDTPAIAAHGTTPGSQSDVVSAQERVGGSAKIVWLAVIVAIGIILAYTAGLMR